RSTLSTKAGGGSKARCRSTSMTAVFRGMMRGSWAPGLGGGLGRNPGRREFAEQAIAGILAMPAGFRARGAVSVVRPVGRALLGADIAREDTGMELRLDQGTVRFGLPNQQPGGQVADVRAVEVRADAAAQGGGGRG